MIEVIVPAMRKSVYELLASLAFQTQRPDLVTIISNEVEPVYTPLDLIKTRWITFESDEYLYGYNDVVLRLNIGLQHATEPLVVFQNDDQIAPPTMIEDCALALKQRRYVWGNHRLVDFAAFEDWRQIMHSDPDQARSRENPTPPARHGFYSCYGGMFAAQTDVLKFHQGFDMAYLGRHGSEDQQLGYRLMRHEGESSVVIYEPPFAFHPIELKGGPRAPYEPGPTNACVDGHALVDETINEAHFRRCTRCPYRFSDQPGELIRDHVLIAFQPRYVRAESVWL